MAKEIEMALIYRSLILMANPLDLQTILARADPFSDLGLNRPNKITSSQPFRIYQHLHLLD